ncbi:DNA primase [Nibricoccus sp. IMCC34717]|uniref:DNA primase n=1 Tax=Nibricoccus sp. IMCC34717 TaxID=3034021 RepID=UPI00384F20FE
MPVIKPTCLRDIKTRVNLADVVSRVVALRKVGSRFKGLCPFHQEKSPSFHVDPDRGFYKCFGCGKAGDQISFVRETEQLTFTEAIEALGQRFAIPIEYEEGGPTQEDRSLRQELFDIHEVAAEYYHEVYKGANPTGDYMREYWVARRRFPAVLAEEFKIGAAPANDTGLAALMLKKRFSEEALRQCGLFFMRDNAVLTLGALRCRFRGRLMIPIREPQGRVVAFTARQCDLTPQDDPSHEAKYVNSPETPIFSKSHLLFNLDRARSQVGDGKPFVLVEGQLDALRSWQVGVKTAVATQGTAITESQIALLRRFKPEVECLFDSDAAGQKAALRFLPLALRAGVEVRFLGGGGAAKIDPDLLFLEKGLAALDDLRRSARSAMAFACQSLLPDPVGVSGEQRARACRELFVLIAHAESEIARNSYLDEAARLWLVAPSALQRDFQAFAQRDPQARQSARSGPEPESEPQADSAESFRDSPERHLLGICLQYEGIARALSHNLPHDWINSRDPAGRLLNRVLAEHEQEAWSGKDHIHELAEGPDEEQTVAHLLFEPVQADEPAKLAEQALQQLRQRQLGPKLRQIELALAKAGADSNIDAISLLRQRTELQRQLRAPFRLPGAG